MSRSTLSHWLHPENKSWQKTIIPELFKPEQIAKIKTILPSLSLTQLMLYAQDKNIVQKLVPLFYKYLSKNESHKIELIDFVKDVLASFGIDADALDFDKLKPIFEHIITHPEIAAQLKHILQTCSRDILVNNSFSDCLAKSISTRQLKGHKFLREIIEKLIKSHPGKRPGEDEEEEDEAEVAPRTATQDKLLTEKDAISSWGEKTSDLDTDNETDMSDDEYP